MEITTKIGCKIACTYCPQDRLIEAYKIRSRVFDLSFSDFKTCLDKIPVDVGIEFGGMCEPWLNPECTGMLLYAHEKGHKILVKTTTVGMSLSDIEHLEHIPFKLFQVHLPSIEGFERIQVDEDYLAVLSRLIESRIDLLFHFHGRALNPGVDAILKDKKRKAVPWRLHRRAGSLEMKQRTKLPRRRGAIGCKFRLRSNILLPNGDVLLCSNDYGMTHVLGNLMTAGYESLFHGDEIKKIVQGQKDESLDILCRNCDSFCTNENLSARFKNCRYSFDGLKLRIHTGMSKNGFTSFLQRAFSTLKTR